MTATLASSPMLGLRCAAGAAWSDEDEEAACIERMRGRTREQPHGRFRRYLTVGELARRVGVTVRTIQYYDQQGLLSPSAKGPAEPAPLHRRQRAGPLPHPDPEVPGAVTGPGQVRRRLCSRTPQRLCRSSPASRWTPSRSSFQAPVQAACPPSAPCTTPQRLPRKAGLGGASPPPSSAARARAGSSGASPASATTSPLPSQPRRGPHQARERGRVASGTSSSRTPSASCRQARTVRTARRNRDLATALPGPRRAAGCRRGRAATSSSWRTSPRTRGDDGSFDELRQAVFDHLEAVVVRVPRHSPDAVRLASSGAGRARRSLGLTLALALQAPLRQGRLTTPLRFPGAAPLRDMRPGRRARCSARFLLQAPGSFFLVALMHYCDKATEKGCVRLCSCRG